VSTFSDYSNITSGLFVDWYIPNYSAGTKAPFTFRFSDWHRYIEFDSNPLPIGSLGSVGYAPLQKLLTISPSKNQVSPGTDSLSITINAYEAGNYSDMNWLRKSRIEGSQITVKRALFDDQGELISLTGGNPIGRFKGFVETYAVNDTYDIATGKSDTVINLEVATYTAYLKKKKTGRKTARPNRGAWLIGHEEVVPGLKSPVLVADTSMNNVAKLKSAKFKWGKGD